MQQIQEGGPPVSLSISCAAYALDLSKRECHSELGRDTHRSIEPLDTLRQDIVNGCHGFYMVHQPLVWPEDGRILGMEALLRWKSPVFGEASPVRFIPVLEKDAQMVVEATIGLARKPGINVCLEGVENQQSGILSCVIPLTTIRASITPTPSPSASSSGVWRRTGLPIPITPNNRKKRAPAAAGALLRLIHESLLVCQSSSGASSVVFTLGGKILENTRKNTRATTRPGMMG